MALGFMRRHRRWLFGFLWLVIAAFIILYIPAFQGSSVGSPGETLGRVGGLSITVGEFQRNYVRQRQMYERLSQGKLDPAALRRMGLEEQVFDSLVVERLVILEANRLGLSVDDEKLARSLTTSPELQEDGRFIGVEELRRRLQLGGIGVEEFEESHRSRLLREKLEALVTGGVSVTPEESQREFRRRNERIRAEYLLVETARFRPQVVATDEEIQARFGSKKDAYRIPEKRVVFYILVTAEGLQSRVTLTDQEIEAYYHDHRDDFREEEQVCASHILVRVKTSDSAEGHTDEEARKAAEALLQQIRAGGDFAALAKKSSGDKGSAPGGGDLGCFGRGRMVPEFDGAVFSMAVGETSALVKTDFGYHIIRVSSRREETVPPLAQLKERIRQTLVNERARALAEENAQAVSGVLRRGRGLEEAARGRGLTVLKSPPMARGEAEGPLGSPALVARAFELKLHETEAEPFRIPRGQAFISLAEIQSSRLPELREAQDRVRTDLVEQKALERALDQAAQIKAQAEKLGLEKAAAGAGLVRKETPSLVGRGQALGDLGSSLTLDDVAHSLPEKTLSDPVRVGTGYAILRVLERTPVDPAAFAKEKEAVAASLRRERKDQLFQAYMNQARQRFPVERRAEAFRRVAG